jgi:hypothetical protein
MLRYWSIVLALLVLLLLALLNLSRTETGAELVWLVALMLVAVFAWPWIYVMRAFRRRDP